MFFGLLLLNVQAGGNRIELEDQFETHSIAQQDLAPIGSAIGIKTNAVSPGHGDWLFFCLLVSFGRLLQQRPHFNGDAWVDLTLKTREIGNGLELIGSQRTLNLAL